MFFLVALSTLLNKEHQINPLTEGVQIIQGTFRTDGFLTISGVFALFSSSFPALFIPPLLSSKPPRASPNTQPGAGTSASPTPQPLQQLRAAQEAPLGGGHSDTQKE